MATENFELPQLSISTINTNSFAGGSRDDETDILSVGELPQAIIK